jgi:PadR family transcriptional regulator PadR
LVVSARSAYGYEIMAQLRDQGFSGIAEGTIYALLFRIEKKGLVDLERVPSDKGPLRKVYSLNRNDDRNSKSSGRHGVFLPARSTVSKKESSDMGTSYGRHRPRRGSA